MADPNADCESQEESAHETANSSDGGGDFGDIDDFGGEDQDLVAAICM